MSELQTRAVIGIDPSSKKLAMVATRDNLVWDTHSFWLRDPNKRQEINLACRNAYVFVRTVINELHDMGDQVVIAVEEPLLGRGGAKATIPQAKVFGAVMAACMIHDDVHIVTAPVPTWKKYYTGRGNAGKDEVGHAVMKAWPSLYESIKTDQDLLDAAAINRYAAHIADNNDYYKTSLDYKPEEPEYERFEVGNTIFKILKGKIVGYESKKRKGK